MHKRQPIVLPAAAIRLSFAAGGMMILMALLFAFSPSNKVKADSSDKDLAITKYQFIEFTRIDSCKLCHTNAPDLNPYGSAYLSDGRDLAAFGLIENLDSDGDGFTNIQEINALYFPGDPNDHPPAASPTPTQAASPTPTQAASPTPTQIDSPTPTESASPTATETPTPTATPIPGEQYRFYLPIVEKGVQ